MSTISIEDFGGPFEYNWALTTRRHVEGFFARIIPKKYHVYIYHRCI